MKKTYQTVKFIYQEELKVDILLQSNPNDSINFDPDWLKESGE